MSASDRTPTGSPTPDPIRDSDPRLPRTYGRTHGDEVVTERDRLAERTARDDEKVCPSVDLELFHVEPVTPPEPEPVEKLSADRRRTLRQKADIDRGIHPLRRLSRTYPDVGTCGDCAHRLVLRYHNRSWPKCEQAEMTHGAGTDCRAWWPACDRYEPGDGISPDAACWTPERSTR